VDLFRVSQDSLRNPGDQGSARKPVGFRVYGLGFTMVYHGLPWFTMVNTMVYHITCGNHGSPKKDLVLWSWFHPMGETHYCDFEAWENIGMFKDY